MLIAKIERTPAAEVPDFDPRIGEEQVDMEPVKELEEVPLSSEDTSRVVRIGKNLTHENK